MPGYLVLRILLFIPTMLGILLVSFFLSRQVPGDPVTQLMGESLDNPQASGNPFRYYSEYARAAERIDRDLPAFYFSLAPAHLPGPYFSEPHPRYRAWYEQLGTRWKNTKMIGSFVTSYRRIGRSCWDAWKNEEQKIYLSLEGRTDASEMASDLRPLVSPCPPCGTMVKQLEGIHQTEGVSHIPALYWWGGENAFHRWMADLLVFDFGLSLRDGRPATARVREALIWTLWMNALALAGLLGIGLPLGVWLAVSPKKRRTAAVSSLLYAGYAVPSFWLATLLLMLFSTTEWGRNLGSWMLRSPLLMADDITLGDRLRVLILPAISIVVPSLAFVSRQMEQSVEREMGKLYVMTARAKGLSRLRTVWRHVVPNALFPVITWLATLIPALLAGSVVIEVIFNIPGMGRLMWESIFGRDWPVVFTVLVLTSFLALFGQLFADLLYALLDPRVQFGTQRSDDGGS